MFDRPLIAKFSPGECFECGRPLDAQTSHSVTRLDGTTVYSCGDCCSTCNAAFDGDAS